MKLALIAIVIINIIASVAMAQSGPQTPLKAPSLEELNNAQRIETLQYQNAALTMQILERSIKERQVVINDLAKKAEEAKKAPAPAKVEPKK
jgi:hypothetical protein